MHIVPSSSLDIQKSDHYIHKSTEFSLIKVNINFARSSGHLVFTLLDFYITFDTSAPCSLTFLSWTFVTLESPLLVSVPLNSILSSCSGSSVLPNFKRPVLPGHLLCFRSTVLAISLEKHPSPRLPSSFLA